MVQKIFNLIKIGDPVKVKEDHVSRIAGLETHAVESRTSVNPPFAKDEHGWVWIFDSRNSTHYPCSKNDFE